jgi:3-methyladenine DNA glycosylase AlkD
MAVPALRGLAVNGKAIGETHRQFAYPDREAVRVLPQLERAMLSPLSLREAGKHLPLPNAGQAKEGTAP